MKSIYALVAAIVAAALTSLLVLENEQWSVAWFLAPLAVGILLGNLKSQAEWADKTWEVVVTTFAAIIFLFIGSGLGIYAWADMTDEAYLSSSVLFFGLLVSAGLMTFGFLLSVATSPQDEVNEVAPSTGG